MPKLIVFMADFKWHKVSDKEKEEIRKNAKSLLDEFNSKLSQIKTTESYLENDSGLREEGDGWKTDSDFKDIMLLNAPFVEDDLIIAEKGGWKK